MVRFPLSTWLVAPTSTSARPATFRPEVEIAGRTTRVLAEQTTAIDPGRLGESFGHLAFGELRRVEAAADPGALTRALAWISAQPVRRNPVVGRWRLDRMLGLPADHTVAIVQHCPDCVRKCVTVKWHGSTGILQCLCVVVDYRYGRSDTCRPHRLD